MSNHDNKYQENTKNESPRQLAKRFLNYLSERSTIIDLGAGAGVDSLFFADSGHSVCAIDREVSVLEARLDEKRDTYSNNVSVMKGDFYNITLPECDAIYASYSLPFCATSSFNEKWLSIDTQLKVGTLIAIVLFGDNDDWCRNTERFTFHSTESANLMLDNYEILFLDNSEYDGKSMRPNGDIVDKHWHVIEIIAKKINHKAQI